MRDNGPDGLLQCLVDFEYSQREFQLFCTPHAAAYLSSEVKNAAFSNWLSQHLSREEDSAGKSNK
jgi:hypothetical protein